MFKSLQMIINSVFRYNSKTAEIDLKIILESCNDVLILCDVSGIAKYVTPSSFDLLGVPPESIIGGSHLTYVVPSDLPRLEAARAEHNAGKGKAKATFRMMHSNGSIVWVEGSGRSVRDSKRGCINHVVILRDMTDRKVLEDKLAVFASRISLRIEQMPARRRRVDI